MRKLFLSLLMISLLLPAGNAMAQTAQASTDPNHPAFAQMKSKADPQILADVMNDAGFLTANMCNPVVFAYQATGGNEVVAKKLEMKTAVYNAQVNPLTDNCYNAINSTKFVQDRRQDTANLNNAIWNFLAGALGISADQVKQIAQGINLNPSSFIVPDMKNMIKGACRGAEEQRTALLSDVKSGAVGRTAITAAGKKGALNFNFSAAPPKDNGGQSTNKSAVRVPTQQQQQAAPAKPAAPAVQKQPQQPQQSAPAAPAKPRNIYQ